jgi:hypothetical protein
MKYLDHTWIGKMKQRTKSRREPIFNHTLWNKYQATLEGDQKTNNTVGITTWALACLFQPGGLKMGIMDRFKTEEMTRKSLLHQAAMVISGSDKTGT